MASIVMSVIAADSAQKDGRRWIQEHFVDSLGVQYERFYLCAAGWNADAQLSADAGQLLTDLAANEVAANVAQIIAEGSLASLQFNYSTVADLRAAGREAYRNATRVEAVMIGDFLSSLTDNQLQNIFNLTQGQVTALRTNKLTPAAATAAEIRAAVGA